MFFCSIFSVLQLVQGEINGGYFSKIIVNRRYSSSLTAIILLKKVSVNQIYPPIKWSYSLRFKITSDLKILPEKSIL